MSHYSNRLLFIRYQPLGPLNFASYGGLDYASACIPLNNIDFSVQRRSRVFCSNTFRG